jgi:predicted patatin/cPLA2 family phospholipase
MHFHLPQLEAASASFTNLVHQVKNVMKPYKHEKESEAHQVRQTNFFVIYPEF